MPWTKRGKKRVCDYSEQMQKFNRTSHSLE